MCQRECTATTHYHDGTSNSSNLFSLQNMSVNRSLLRNFVQNIKKRLCYLKWREYRIEKKDETFEKCPGTALMFQWPSLFGVLQNSQAATELEHK